MIENEYVDGILDNDHYKFTMQNSVCFNYPSEKVRYKFINRDKREFPSGFADELKRILDTFRGFKLTKDEKQFLSNIKYLNPVYIDFLSNYQFDPFEVDIRQNDENLDCSIEGLWYKTILWEVPLMATISQLYFEMTGKQNKKTRHEREKNNKEKVEGLDDLKVKYIDYGTRRRESLQNHQEVIQDFIKYGNFLFGTSNQKLAMDNGLKPIGTLAHEYIMFHAAKYGYIMADKMSNDSWIKTYHGNLGIALPDTFTTDIFLNSFDSYYARLYDGVRQDSGAPIEFFNKIINHYNNLKIDPTTKTIVFSDNIKSIALVRSIHAACDHIIRDIYGIGTWFTNDVGLKPLNMVIKMSSCFLNNRWIDTVKLSDDLSKNTGDEMAVEICKKTLFL